jgi:hypothetical protein
MGGHAYIQPQPRVYTRAWGRRPATVVADDRAGTGGSHSVSLCRPVGGGEKQAPALEVQGVGQTLGTHDVDAAFATLGLPEEGPMQAGSYGQLLPVKCRQRQNDRRRMPNLAR